jgi:short-subunit dehydrogenase
MRRRRRNAGRKALLAGGIGLGLAGAVLARYLRRGEALTGQVALITGSSRGLGFLLAREFARQGCRLVVCARDETELERARRDLEETDGAEVLAVPCDVADRSQVARLVSLALERFGRIDILVNNAGTIQVGPLRSMQAEDFEQAMRVMFWGVLYPTLEVLPDMLHRRSGRIVNVTSIGAKVSVPHMLPYTCAKFAALGLSEGLRAELKKEGIRVTTVVPGLMRTGSFLNAHFKGKQDREFSWFTMGAAMPFISMNAERAARQIVAAAQRGSAERVLSLPAKLLERFHAMFPGLTAELIAWADRLVLPSAEGGSRARDRGMEIQQRARSRVFRAVTGLGFSAAERYHQHPGPIGSG